MTSKQVEQRNGGWMPEGLNKLNIEPLITEFPYFKPLLIYA